ncbi:MAG TPA: ChbG/HpnK family deacetylase, partial [Phnomibacter sp.]|nr:ChbG/HpnK family deacetylase [Phnomibacter sp.]
MKKTVFTFLIALACFRVTAQPDPGAIPVLIRCDDIGMCQSVNAAARQVLETGMPVSMSVMVNCPWFSDAVALLNKYYNVSVGIHLTLNSEWKQYKWGPVAGASAVPTLVDSLGYFFPSRSLLYANQPKLEEIELELRLQIVKALKAGLDVDYLDYHMGTAVQTPETRAIVEKLAKEFGLAISRYFDEVDVPGGYIAPITSKLDTLTALMKNLKP